LFITKLSLENVIKVKKLLNDDKLYFIDAIVAEIEG